MAVLHIGRHLLSSFSGFISLQSLIFLLLSSERVLFLAVKVFSFLLHLRSVVVIVILDPVLHLSVKVLVELIVLILGHVLLVLLILDVAQMGLFLLLLSVFLDLFYVLMVLNMVS